MPDFDFSSFHEICSIGDGIKYVEMNNTVGQRWYIPLRNSKTHLSLFQPSSDKGKIIVKLFNVIKYFPFVLHLINAKIIRLNFSSDFIAFINELFKFHNCDFGIFCGSPGNHQKITLLVAHEKTVLGYCKLSDKDCIKDLFKKESNTLDYLHKKGINDIPKSLFCGNLSFCNNIDIFVQSTRRNGKIKSATPTSKELIYFVNKFNIKTSQIIPFNESDFAKSLNRLSNNLHLLEDREIQSVYRKAIDMISEHSQSPLAFCAYHGDLTPWNSFIVDRKLFAFDLEYFKSTYTPWCDYFHFFTQDMLYNAYADAEQIYHQYQEIRQNVLAKVQERNILYLSYLLIIADFYLDRDNGILNNRLDKCFKIWSQLIKYLIKDVKESHQQ